MHKSDIYFMFFPLIFMVFLTVTSKYNNATLNHDVAVLQDASSKQCTDDWQGIIDPVNINDLNEINIKELQSFSLKVCSGCHLDPDSNTCVCKTCYSLFN